MRVRTLFPSARAKPSIKSDFERTPSLSLSSCMNVSRNAFLFCAEVKKLAMYDTIAYSSLRCHVKRWRFLRAVRDIILVPQDSLFEYFLIHFIFRHCRAVGRLLESKVSSCLMKSITVGDIVSHFLCSNLKSFLMISRNTSLIDLDLKGGEPDRRK